MPRILILIGAPQQLRLELKGLVTGGLDESAKIVAEDSDTPWKSLVFPIPCSPRGDGKR